jgi:hypothetical protein
MTSPVDVSTKNGLSATTSSPLSTGSPPNPYNQKKSYKQALLTEVEGAANRTRIDTFKLIHLLHSKQPYEDANGVQEKGQAYDPEQENESKGSDTTQQRENCDSWYTSRMCFQITLPETAQDTFLEELVHRVNQVLEVINFNTPGVKLAPWHTLMAKKDELRTELSDDTMELIKYLYGFKAGMSRPGPQYFRINLAIPLHYTPDDIERKNKNSIMIPGQQSLLKANSQSINPVTIGWFLRSNHTMADTLELEQLLRTMWTVRGGFGLYWATVKTHKAYDPKNTTRAIHIETEEDSANVLFI